MRSVKERYNQLRTEINKITYKIATAAESDLAQYQALPLDQEPSDYDFIEQRMASLGLPSGMNGIFFVMTYVMPEWNDNEEFENVRNGEIGVVRIMVATPSDSERLYVARDHRGDVIQLFIRSGNYVCSQVLISGKVFYERRTAEKNACLFTQQ